MGAQTEERKGLGRFAFAVYTGFFAGLFFGFLKVISYYLGFSKVIPAFLAEPFYRHDFLVSWAGHGIGWAYFTVFSILAALLYALLLYKLRGPWAGLAYGVLCWLLMYGWVGPAFEMMKPLQELDRNSLLTDFCLFLLWGVFIGYTIAFEFTEERVHEPFDNFDGKHGNS